MQDPGTITRAINAVGFQSVDGAFPLVYEEMKKLAGAQLARQWSAGLSPPALEPADLVHSAYLKLFGSGNPGWEHRRHFFGAAANAMRQILIDEARKRRVRREAVLSSRQASAVTFGFSEWGPDELLALDDALVVLDKTDTRLSEVVRLRIFAEQPIEEVAQLIGQSATQTYRDWRAAKAFLYQRMLGADRLSQPNRKSHGGDHVDA